jgi:Cu(I)/Ag(I) efflux system protein CusF
MSRGWILIVLLAAGQAFAQAPEPAHLGPNEGEVMEIDKAAREITIRHGYLPELSMDPMSMVFNVHDAALLDRVKKGDRIKFKAGLVDGRFAVIAIDPIKPKRKVSP